MTDTPALAAPAPTEPAPAHSAFRVLAALADLGEATAAAVADHTDLGYSTVTPKLRAWETSGHAERFRTTTNQTLWRLTATGRTTTTSAATGEPATTAPPAVPPPDHAAPTTGSPGSHPPTPAECDTPLAPATPDDLPREATDVPAAANPDEDNPRQGTETQANAQDTGHATEPGSGDVAGSPSADGDANLGDTIGEPLAPAGPRPAEDTSAQPAPDDPATNPPGPQDSDPEPADAEPTGDTVTTPATDRRSSGSLRGAILDILEANPANGYKVSELCKLIDRANEGTSAKKASAGAVANAAHKLAEQGQAVLRVEKPATFALAATDA